MTIIFVGKRSLIVDNVALWGGVAVSATKLMPVSTELGDGVAAICGWVKQGTAMLDAYLANLPCGQFYDNDASQTDVFLHIEGQSYVLSGSGSIVATPIMSEDLEMYGDGGRAFIQCSSVLREDPGMSSSSFYRLMKTLWFQHDSRSSYDFVLEGVHEGEIVNATSREAVGSKLVELASVMIAEPRKLDEDSPQSDLSLNYSSGDDSVAPKISSFFDDLNVSVYGKSSRGSDALGLHLVFHDLQCVISVGRELSPETFSCECFDPHSFEGILGLFSEPLENESLSHDDISVVKTAIAAVRSMTNAFPC